MCRITLVRRPSVRIPPETPDCLGFGPLPPKPRDFPIVDAQIAQRLALERCGMAHYVKT